MVQCWAEKPHDRLEFNEVVVKLNKLSKGLDDSYSDPSSNSHMESSGEASTEDETHEGSPLIKDQ